jgi:hypothetical protein
MVVVNVKGFGIVASIQNFLLLLVVLISERNRHQG